jgi:DNA topoisomerase I
MLGFARNFPALRRRVSRLLGEPGFGKERVLACSVSMLDHGLFRVGGEEYTDENGSYGLATLERRHVRLDTNRTLSFEYVGKAGQQRANEIRDLRIYAAVSELKLVRRRDPRLLAYRDAGGWCDAHAGAINEFIKEVMGAEHSAKDFRTWHANVLAATVS